MAHPFVGNGNIPEWLIISASVIITPFNYVYERYRQYKEKDWIKCDNGCCRSEQGICHRNLHTI